MGCVLMGLCVLAAAVGILVALGYAMNGGVGPQGEWYE